MPNRLAQQKSPYLKQHQDNPVDWYPWGEEAFERARREDKPILLSVGYSACHWCHVMAHESFENPEIAARMNELFINIKVDREEHPDVDQIYQQVSQLMTRSGGWPLTVFMTPQLKPFFGGTYYPPEDRYGRPGFLRLLDALSRAYRGQRSDVEENARRLLEAMRDELPALRSEVDGAGRPDGLLLELQQSAEKLVGIVDWDRGGLGSAPKFPNVMALSFLWRAGQAFDLKPCRQAAILSLVRMSEGGIYDQLGGGFHRYSVDDQWAVPHFEKMLYDNALLLKLYAEVLLSVDGSGQDLLAGDVRELFVEVLAETVDYVLREMTTSQGAFYSAQDADSEGEEGKYFAWTPGELARVLTPDEARVFGLRYGVTPEGNFEHGATVLHLARSLDEIAVETRLSESSVRECLAFACAKLKEVRSRRIAPGLDDKILVSWNGLMISGLAWASSALVQAGRTNQGHRASIAAHRALDWIAQHAFHPGDGSLDAVLGSDGESRIPGRLDDWAFLVRGALDLVRFLPEEAKGSRLGLIKARAGQWAGQAWSRFADDKSGGFFMTESSRRDLIQRPASLHDQAIPSGSAVLLDALLELRELGESGPAWAAELDRRLEAHREVARVNPFGFSEMASVLLKWTLGVAVVQGQGSVRHQGHFSVTQDAGEALAPGSMQVCHAEACHRLDAGEVASFLRQRLVPGLQSSGG